MLQAPVFAVGVAGCPGLARVDQPQFGGDAQQRDVAEVAGQFGVYWWHGRGSGTGR